jgi:hypothetical protein
MAGGCHGVANVMANRRNENRRNIAVETLKRGVNDNESYYSENEKTAKGK